MREKLLDFIYSEHVNKFWSALVILFLTIITLNDLIQLSLLNAHIDQLQGDFSVHLPSMIAIGAIYSAALLVIGGYTALRIMKNKLGCGVTERLTQTRNFSLIFLAGYCPLFPYGITGSTWEAMMSVVVVSFFISFVIRYEFFKKRMANIRSSNISVPSQR